MKMMLKRIVAFFVLFTMILSNFSGIVVFAADNNLPNNVENDATVNNNTNLTEKDLKKNNSEALHFIFRHWHLDEDSEAMYQGEDGSQSDGSHRYFVVVEGYIVKSDQNNYKFYIARQNHENYKDSNDEASETNKYLEEIDKDFSNSNPYVKKVDPQAGKIILNTKPLNNEEFAGISLSAGQDAVNIQSTDEGKEIEISYIPDKKIHLVKGHAFYKSNEVVNGSNDEDVFGSNEISNDSHIDTVYGTVDSEGNISNSSLTQQDSSQVKIYNTQEGLHTDKTATEVEDSYGRVFDIDLEAWNVAGKLPKVGMVLDASGSMAFASDKPEIISIDNLEPDVKSLLVEKKGLLNKTDLIGFYEFQQNKVSSDDPVAKNYRTWFLNTVKGGDPANYGQSKEAYEAASPDSFAKVKYYRESNKSDNNFDFSNGKSVKIYNDLDENITSWGNFPLNFSEANGMSLDFQNGAALILDSVPKNEEFTVSFSLKQISNKNLSNDDQIEILYIGPENVNLDSDNYVHLYRKGNKLIIDMPETNRVIESNFTSIDNHFYSLVFENDGLKVYRDGSELNISPLNVTNLKYESIVFAPFENTYNSNDSERFFYLDNIYVHEIALKSEKIVNLFNKAGQKIELINEEAFLNDGELKEVFNQFYTDNSKHSYANYTYYVFDPTEGTESYIPLGYRDNSDAISTVRTGAGVGWYYVNSGSLGSSLTSIGPIKQSYGIDQNRKIIDNITHGSTLGTNGAAPDIEKAAGNGNTLVSYVSNSKSPVKFFVDSNGNLRCFYTLAEKNYVSYVYELVDNKYIKTEALQRAIGSFVTDLSNKSPSSSVSAVRFSQDKTDKEYLNNLVLLDWTNNTVNSTEFMNLKNKTKEIRNYILTGGTHTETGLQTFYDNLVEKDEKDPTSSNNSKEKKYLIIFTDGLDDLVKKQGYNDEALNYAKKLKEAGYTIFTVMLEGSLKEDSDTYDKAQKFLTNLSGTNNTTEIEKENYFFSVSKAKKLLEDKGQDTTKMNDADILTEIFSEEILSLVVDPLEDYAIKDYIDPRFDLVNSENIVWHLNAEGKIQVGSDPEELLSSEGKEINLKDGSNPKAQKAKLYYDDSKDMYYLEWTDQTIPTSYIGANKLYVWRSRITVKAKDDFIGGNAVLTNGNNSNMNYVFNPSIHNVPNDIYSGVTNLTGPNPSKGFPRVTVNVTPYSGAFSITDSIYLGESIDPSEILNEITEKLINLEVVDQDEKAQLYLEYLSRYLKYHPTSKDNLTFKFDDEGNYNLELPYSYLPNGLGSNQTGTDLHKSDYLGIIKYSIKINDRGPYEKIDKKPVRMDIDITFNPYDVNVSAIKNRIKSNESLIEDDYKWNIEYKPSVGKNVESGSYVSGIYTNNVFSGDIAAVLDNPDNFNIEDISVRLNVNRSYNNTSGTFGYYTLTSESTNGIDVNSEGFTKQNESENPFKKEDGLPIGEYTFSIDSDKSSTLDGYHYEVSVVNDKDSLKSDMFNAGNDCNYPNVYPALVSENGIISLGKVNENDERSYLDSRFGLVKVTLVKDNDKPEEPADPVKIEKTPGEGKSVKIGDQITYEISWKNYKKTEANIEVIDKLADYFDFVSASPENTFTYDKTSNTVTWNLGKKAPKEEGTVLITVKLNENIGSLTKVENTGKVIVDEEEKDTNKVTNPYGIVSIEKKHKIEDSKKEYHKEKHSNLKGGEIIQYNLTVANGTENIINNVIVSDPIPEGLIVDKDSITSSKPEVNITYDANDVITWDVGTLNSNQSVELYFEAEIPSEDLEYYWYNHAYLTYDSQDESSEDIDESTHNQEESFESKPEVNIEDDIITEESEEQIFEENDQGTEEDILNPSHSQEDVVDGNQINDLYQSTINEDSTLGELEEQDNQSIIFEDLISKLKETNSLAINTLIKSNHPLVPESDTIKVSHSSDATVDDSKNLLYSNDVIEHYVPITEDPKEPDDSIIPDNPDSKYLPEIVKEQSVNNGSRVKTLQNVNSGDFVTYYLTVVNTTGSEMSSVNIWDTIPKGLNFIEDEAYPGYTYDSITNTISWNISKLASNESITVWFKVQVQSVTEITNYKNQFFMDYDQNPKDGSIESNIVELVQLIPDNPKGPNLIINKKQSVTRKNSEGFTKPNDGRVTSEYIEVRKGDIVTYYIEVANTGDETAYNVVISDSIPDGLVYVPNSETRSEWFSYDDHTLTWKIPLLEAGKTIQVEFKVLVSNTTDNSDYWTNIAYVKSDENTNSIPSNKVNVGDTSSDSASSENSDPKPDNSTSDPANKDEAPNNNGNNITNTDSNSNNSNGAASTNTGSTVSSSNNTATRNVVNTTNNNSTTTTSTTSPKTGVNSNLFVWILLIIVCCTVVVYLSYRQKKKI